MALSDFNHIKDVIAALDIQRPSRFGFTEAAVNATGQAEIDALTGEYIIDDGSQINSIPAADMVGFDPIIIDIGLRTQAATVPRMAFNHFFGRLSLNLLKLTDKLNLLVRDHLVNRYITPSGNVTEHITVAHQADTIQIIQHQSPLSASEPITASAAVSVLAAVDNGNAGVMTGADKKSLNDLLSRTLTIAGVKTFSSIPELPAADPTTDNQAVRKAFVGAEVTRVINETLAAVEERKGFQVFTSKQSGDMCSFNKGILSVSEGVLGVGQNVLKIETTPEIVPISSDLTAGNWYVIYCDTTGNLTVELLSGATSYTTFPLTQLDTACPLESKKLARYKSGDSSKRAIAIAYSLPAVSEWNSGTTYSVTQMCSYNGSVWVSLKGSNTNQVPGVATTYWAEMGTPNRLFAPKIYNFPDETFGTGELGDVSLDGTGLGATATPFYGIEEETASTPKYYPEYQFNNLTLSGVCYCGKSNGNALAPVIIRVKGTLTIESGGQLNGDARGANGGAGGSGGTATSTCSAGGAGGAGAKSGRPIFIYANRIINKKTSGYWITCRAGNPSNGLNGSAQPTGTYYAGGGGGGGSQSTSSLIIITNSELNKDAICVMLFSLTASNGGDSGILGHLSCLGGGGGGAGGIMPDSNVMGKGGIAKMYSATGWANRGSSGGGYRSKGENYFYEKNSSCSVPLTEGMNGGSGGGKHGSFEVATAKGYNGGGGGSGISIGGAGGQVIGAGGGGGGGVNADAAAGSAPTVSHDRLGTLLIIENYSTRYGI
jgi:hypothetical protein